MVLISLFSGGQSSIRASWAQYFSSACAVILVVDSCDTARLNLSRDELHRICADEVSYPMSIPIHSIEFNKI